MTTIKMSSDEARSKWREVLDKAVAGNQIIIERYGKPVAVIVPHSEYVQSSGQAKMVREETAVYQTNDWEAVKAELVAELKSELLSEPKLREALLQYELAQMQQNEIIHQEQEVADLEQPYPQKVVNIYTPHLVHSEQAADFRKEIIAELPDAEV